MTESDFHNFGGFVHQALIDGMNSKLLHVACGLNWHEMGIALRDDTLTPDQKNAIATEIDKWRKSNLKPNI